MIAAKALRRKFDYQLLRWQARLDGEWADRVLPLVAAAVLFTILAALSLARVRTFDTDAVLARWTQGAWLITNGHGTEVTIGDGNLFEPQAAFGFWLIAQLTRLIPAIPLLVVAQSAALALGVIPVWRLCRKVCSLRAGAAVAAVVAYGCHPSLHQLNLADFHPEAIAVPLLLGTAYAGLRRHWIIALILAVLAMSLRADLGLTVAAIGAVVLIDTRARQARRLVILGLVWSVVALLVVQPRLGDGGFVHAEAFAAYGDTVPGVLWGMLSDPLALLGDVLARSSFAMIVAVAAPVAFLPLLAPRYLLPAIAPLVVVVVADVPLDGVDGIANTIPALVFAFIALPFALSRIGRRNIERITVDRRVLGALLLAAVVFFVNDSPSSPYEGPWNWGGRSLTDQARLEAVSLVPDDAAVRSSVPTLAELAERPELFEAIDGRMVGGRQLADGVDAVLIDRSLTDGWDEFRRVGVERAVLQQGFELVLDRDGVLLFLRSSAADP